MRRLDLHDPDVSAIGDGGDIGATAAGQRQLVDAGKAMQRQQAADPAPDLGGPLGMAAVDGYDPQ